MGIEKQYNDILKGENGYTTYQKDLKGYKIANTPEIKVDAIQGKDIYLTIDANLQYKLEQIAQKTMEETQAEAMMLIAADSQTGEILSYISYPSVDLNEYSF